MNIRYLVVHCSDSPDDRLVDAKTIHQWHKQRGWNGIGYHRVIHRSGSWEMGRPDYWPGAHVQGHNHHSLGVCLIGQMYFTAAQLNTLRLILRQWLLEHPQAEIVGHTDLNPGKTCPNFNVRAWAAIEGLQPLETPHV